jgi:hypothetical protein
MPRYALAHLVRVQRPAPLAGLPRDDFVRIKLIAKGGDDLRILDLQKTDVREAIETFVGTVSQPLYESELAADLS